MFGFVFMIVSVLSISRWFSHSEPFFYLSLSCFILVTLSIFLGQNYRYHKIPELVPSYLGIVTLIAGGVNLVLLVISFFK
jgi:hypothetical protein